MTARVAATGDRTFSHRRITTATIPAGFLCKAIRTFCRECRRAFDCWRWRCLDVVTPLSFVMGVVMISAAEFVLVYLVRTTIIASHDLVASAFTHG